jgi:hypothetical protein
MGFGHTGVAYIFEEDGEYHAYVVAPSIETYRHITKPDYDQVYASVKNSTHRFVLIEQDSDRFWRHAVFLNPRLLKDGPSQRAYDEAPANLRKLNIARKNVERYRAHPDIAEGFKTHVASYLLWFRLNGIALDPSGEDYVPVVPFFEEVDDDRPDYEEYQPLLAPPLETARLNQYGTMSRKRWF